jgi:LTXXQ motif family protein
VRLLERVKQLQSINWKALTDRRIEVVKAALQLKPDQEKYWPAVEKAIRERAEARQQRLEKLAARLNAQGEPNPITFMRDRAESLSQRSAELKKLADAWQQLYESLDADQKGRLRFLAVYVLNEVREARENRVKEEEDED